MSTGKKSTKKPSSRPAAMTRSGTGAVEVQQVREADREALALLPDVGLHVHDEPVSVFNALKAATKSSQRHSTLENLREACDIESRTRNPNFDYANIARRVKALNHKSPTSQTIYNNPGLKALIAAYQSHYTPSQVSAEEHVLRGISDPHTRHEVRLLQSENDKLRRRVNILHEQYQRLEMAAVPSREDPTIRSGVLNPEEGRERRAVAAFVRHVEQHGLYWDEASGALLQNRGGKAPREVGGPGLRQALDRLLGDDSM